MHLLYHSSCVVGSLCALFLTRKTYSVNCMNGAAIGWGHDFKFSQPCGKSCGRRKCVVVPRGKFRRVMICMMFSWFVYRMALETWGVNLKMPLNVDISGIKFCLRPSRLFGGVLHALPEHWGALSTLLSPLDPAYSLSSADLLLYFSTHLIKRTQTFPTG